MNRFHELYQVLGHVEFLEEPRLLRYMIRLTIRQVYRVISLIPLRIVLLEQSQQVIIYVSVNNRIGFRGCRRGCRDEHNIRGLKRGIAPESWILAITLQNYLVEFTLSFVQID